jgi:c(7)-type cytochrome triheme protein
MKNVTKEILFIGVIVSTMSLCSSTSIEAAPKSHEYGNVIMHPAEPTKNGSNVTFKHWSHRGNYTCRLCHIDLEFSQIANDTGVLEEDNQAGMYCGACHNGQEAFSIDTCTNCHPKDKGAEKKMAREAKNKFRKFKKTMPPAGYGNKIDWMKAEKTGKIKPVDFLKGLSIKENTSKMVNRRNEPRSAKLPGLPDIIFSHSKHVIWAGCGMCHPDTFALETGKTQMTMDDITKGKFCGRCHGTVAFALNDCTRCHSKPVSQ